MCINRSSFTRLLNFFLWVSLWKQQITSMVCVLTDGWSRSPSSCLSSKSKSTSPTLILLLLLLVYGSVVPLWVLTNALLCFCLMIHSMFYINLTEGTHPREVPSSQTHSCGPNSVKIPFISTADRFLCTESWKEFWRERERVAVHSIKADLKLSQTWCGAAVPPNGFRFIQQIPSPKSITFFKKKEKKKWTSLP